MVGYAFAAATMKEKCVDSLSIVWQTAQQSDSVTIKAANPMLHLPTNEETGFLAIPNR
jgi:hypothetical protein